MHATAPGVQACSTLLRERQGPNQVHAITDGRTHLLRLARKAGHDVHKVIQRHTRLARDAAEGRFLRGGRGKIVLYSSAECVAHPDQGHRSHAGPFLAVHMQEE